MKVVIEDNRLIQVPEKLTLDLCIQIIDAIYYNGYYDDVCGNVEYNNEYISYWDYADKETKILKIENIFIFTYDKEKFISELE